MLDTQTTSVGLGLIVEAAARAASAGASQAEIVKIVRGMIPHVYSIFCLQSLNHLAHSGYLDPAQAAIGEMLGIVPFYVLDSGKLIPIQKVRSMRQLVDVLHEFVTEFDNIDHIALLVDPNHCQVEIYKHHMDR